jgi:hypothetical protein
MRPRPHARNASTDTPAAPAPVPGLLPRQEAFCRHVAAGHPLAAAARLAGYGWRGAKQQGSRLLQDPRVAARVAALAGAREERRRAELDALAEVATQILGRALEPGGNDFAALRALDAISRFRGLLGEPPVKAALSSEAEDEADDVAEEAPDPADPDPVTGDPEARPPSEGAEAAPASDAAPPPAMPPELPSEPRPLPRRVDDAEWRATRPTTQELIALEAIHEARSLERADLMRRASPVVAKALEHFEVERAFFRGLAQAATAGGGDAASRR